MGQYYMKCISVSLCNLLRGNSFVSNIMALNLYLWDSKFDKHNLNLIKASL